MPKQHTMGGKAQRILDFWRDTRGRSSDDMLSIAFLSPGIEPLVRIE